MKFGLPHRPLKKPSCGLPRHVGHVDDQRQEEARALPFPGPEERLRLLRLGTNSKVTPRTCFQGHGGKASPRTITHPLAAGASTLSMQFRERRDISKVEVTTL